MSDPTTIVIIGGGLAGASAAMPVTMWDDGVEPLTAVVEPGEPVHPESLR